MDTPAELPPAPHGALRNGKITVLRIESGILGVRGSAFSFSSFVAIYGGFGYLEFPRRSLGVNGHSSGTSPGTARNAAGCKMAELRRESGILGIDGSAFCFSFFDAPSTMVSRVYHCRVGCWASMATPRGVSRRPSYLNGTLRNGKMAELRIASGILWIPGSAFCFPSSPPLLR